MKNRKLVSQRFTSYEILKATHLRCKELIPSYKNKRISLFKLWWKASLLNVWNIVYIPSKQLIPYGIFIFEKNQASSQIIHYFTIKDDSKGTSTVKQVLNNYLAKLSIEGIKCVTIMLPQRSKEDLLIVNYFIDTLGFEIEENYANMMHISNRYLLDDMLLIKLLE